VAGGLLPAADGGPKKVDFGREIRPILADTCFKCHGPDEGARDSALRLDTKEGAFADLGEYRAIVPGELAKSELYRRITSEDPELHMPPVDSGRKLSPQQIESLKLWIASSRPGSIRSSFPRRRRLRKRR
jgi:hypothetical protein